MSTAAAPFTVLIPARLASTRLPNKPLADIAGLPMVTISAVLAYVLLHRHGVICPPPRRPSGGVAHKLQDGDLRWGTDAQGRTPEAGAAADIDVCGHPAEKSGDVRLDLPYEPGPWEDLSAVRVAA